MHEDGQVGEPARVLSERRLAIVKRLEEIGSGSYEVGYASDDPEARGLRRELREIRHQLGKLEEKRALRRGARARIESSGEASDHEAQEHEDEWWVDRGWRLPPRMERYPYRVTLQKNDAVVRARILTFDEHGARQTALARALIKHCALPTGNGLEWAWQGQRPGIPGGHVSGAAVRVGEAALAFARSDPEKDRPSPACPLEGNERGLPLFCDARRGQRCTSRPVTSESRRCQSRPRSIEVCWRTLLALSP